MSETWFLHIDYPKMVENHYQHFAACDNPPPDQSLDVYFSVVSSTVNTMTILPLGISTQWTLILSDNNGNGISRYIKDGYAEISRIK